MSRLPATILAVALSSCLALTAQGPANVLLVVIDDVGVDMVGCYGGPGLTPVIDSLAAGGVRFTRAYANPACAPTRGTILTGRYGFRNGVPGSIGPNDPGLDPNELVLPEALQGSGYNSALIGKWHLGLPFGIASPNVHGWPHFAGTLGPGIANYYNYQKVTDGRATISTRYATTDQVDDALSWIGAQSGPWCMILAFNAPHQPFHAPPAHLHSQQLAGLDPTVTPRPFFYAMLQAMDAELGRLLVTLDPTTRANTNVIVVADNGTDGAVVNPPLVPNHAKGSLFEGGSHVPLIVNGPAVVHPGRTCAAMVATVDLFPTMLELCGVVPAAVTLPDRPIDGLSMRGLLADTASTLRHQVYIDMTNTPLGDGYALKDERYELLRYLWNHPQRQEMYDRELDPLETSDLLQAPLSTAMTAVYQGLENGLAAIRHDGWMAGYGNGCRGTSGVQTLRAMSPPQGNRFFVLNLPDLPLGQVGLVGVGLARDFSRGGAPLPFNMAAYGMQGCDLLIRVDSTVTVNSSNRAGYIWVPEAPFLHGMNFYIQGFVLDPTANRGGMIVTSALRCVIRDQ